MNSFSRSTTAERVGRWLGRAWRGLLRQETRVIQWTISQGVSPSLARPLLWVVKFAIAVLLLYAAFWLALLIGAILVAAKLGEWANRNADQPRFELNDPHDHRQQLFYDPLTHNDIPDPRFEDDERDRY